MYIAAYPGSFDPITNGHLDIIKRAAKIFDLLIVGVAKDTYKDTLFTFPERIWLVKEVLADIPNVKVEGFSGLTVNFAREKKASVIIRGLRAVSDFEYEFQMSIMNRKLASGIETLFLMTCNEYAFLSSSIIKQAASLGGQVKGLVPSVVEKALAERYQTIRETSEKGEAKTRWC